MSAAGPYLQHLDEGNAQIQISHVTADQTQTEHQADGDDSAEVDTARHLDRLAAVEEVGGAGQDLGHDSRKGQVPCCKDDREAEVGVIEEVLVEQDDTGAESDPDTARVSAHRPYLSPRVFKISPHVDCGVERGLGSLLLLRRRVDGGQSLARGLARGADLLAFGTHGERSSLFGKETLKFEGPRTRKASLAEGGGSHEG